MGSDPVLQPLYWPSWTVLRALPLCFASSPALLLCERVVLRINRKHVVFLGGKMFYKVRKLYFVLYPSPWDGIRKLKTTVTAVNMHCISQKSPLGASQVEVRAPGPWSPLRVGWSLERALRPPHCPPSERGTRMSRWRHSRWGHTTWPTMCFLFWPLGARRRDQGQAPSSVRVRTSPREETSWACRVFPRVLYLFVKNLIFEIIDCSNSG